MRTASASIERRDTSEISKSLLDAADMILTLHIVLDTRTQISTKLSPQVSGTSTPQLHFLFIQKERAL
jgi:hypothetical protein